MSFPCPVGSCSSIFKRKDYVYAHIRNQHIEWSEDDIVRYQEAKKKEETLACQARNPFPCPHCYEKRSSKKRLHPNLVVKKTKPTVECPVESCDEVVWTREGLADHCSEKHKTEDIDFEVEEERFGPITEFDEWKHSLEIWSAAGFVKESIHGHRTYYWCARSNRDRSDPSKDGPKKSRRETRHCSAFLTTYMKDDGSLDARFCRDHIGHSCEASKIPLSSHDRTILYGIIDEILRGYGRSSPLYYFSTRMIKELKSRRQDRVWKLHKDDHYSVLERILGGETEGLRRADIDQTQPDLTRIVTISDVQVEWLKKHSHRGVSIDDTFKTSRHKIKLLTLIVVDEFDRGLPAAHLLSYHMTEHDVEYLFKEIVKVHPKFDPSYYMSDAAPALYNGFKRALPNSKASRLYCLWHFLKFVREHVSISFVGSEKERGKKIYSTIKELTVTVPMKDFTHLLTTLMDDLSDTEGDGFKDYFRPYARNRSLWAPYERSTASFNTSMFNEAYHRVLKNVWLPKGRRARLDGLVHTLLTVPQIQDEDLEIEDEKGLLTGKYRLSEQYQRHRKCMEEYKGNTQKITTVSRSEWKVESSGGRKEYTVTDLGGGKCDCDTKNNQNLHCWSTKAGLNCKHVHAALTFSPISDTVPEAPPGFMDNVNEMIDHDHAFQPPIIIQEEEDDANERALDGMMDPAEEEERREEEKKREKIGFMKSEFYEILEDGRNRFNFASRKKENLDDLGEFIKNLKLVVNELPVPHGRRGREPAPRRIRDQHLKFVPPHIQTPGRKQATNETTVPPIVPVDPDQMETCYKCTLRLPPSSSRSTNENEQYPWVKYPLCLLWAHQECVPMGGICEACHSARYEPELMNSSQFMIYRCFLSGHLSCFVPLIQCLQTFEYVI